MYFFEIGYLAPCTSPLCTGGGGGTALFLWTLAWAPRLTEGPQHYCENSGIKCQAGLCSGEDGLSGFFISGSGLSKKHV